jgi:hypothetical protein
MSDFQTLSLHRISELPFDADAEIFQRYPGFKLGVVPCVSYYAELMLPLIKEVITNSPEHDDWILTAPAITAQTPAGANLMSWKLFDLYQHLDPNCATKLSLIDIEHESESTWADWKDPAKPQDYARLDFADRLTEHERISRRLAGNADFHGRAVLFVNDIRVTGAQQQAMQNYFERAEVACVRWLYVIVVDPEIGRAEPRIEWKINFAPFEELLRMVTREQIQFTGKCVQRLMGLTLAELDQVLRALDSERRRRFFELATRNGFENLNAFHEQMELVRSFCE